MFEPNTGYHPPTIINLTISCAADGGRVAFTSNKQVLGTALSAMLTNKATGAQFWVGGFDANRNADSFTITAVPSGSYELTADNGENTKSVDVEVNCNVVPHLVSQVVTQPTAAVRSGTITVVAAKGNSVGPLTIEIAGLTNGIETMDAAAGPGQLAYTRSGIAPGSYPAAIIHDASPAQYPSFQAQAFTIDSPPGLVPLSGCTDPEADNYDPTATSDNGSCVFTPKVVLDELPALAPLGVPLLATLASASVTGAVAAPASVLLDLSALAAAVGVQLRVNGYLFTSGPIIVPGRFTDAPTLLAALQAQPALAAGYMLSQPSATTVRLTARTPGLPGTPVVSTTHPLLIVATLTAGVASLHAQRRERWACYLEIWAGCGSLFGGPVDKASAVLAQRITLDYRAGNAYVFDLAPALRQFTGHGYPLADGSCPDRLVSYFVRFGEEYADTPTGPKRVRTTYESAVTWGLEAMEVPAPNAMGWYLLSARPAPWRVVSGGRVPACWLAPPNPDKRLLLRHRLATSREIFNRELGHYVATGQVTTGNNSFLNEPGALSGELQGSDWNKTPGPVLITVEFGAVGQPLTFVNRQGGQDTVHFNGTPDYSSKRTAATFTNTAGPQAQSAEMALPTKLYSGPLDYATWHWLRRELGVSPTAWLETAAGPVPVLVSDLATESDVAKGDYSLSVDYSTAPVRGLSN